MSDTTTITAEERARAKENSDALIAAYMSGKYDGLIVEHPRKVLRHAQDIGGQWAGPIPEPLEPEES